MPDPAANRRAFLTGEALRAQVEATGKAVADAVVRGATPSRGPTVMLRTAAMATDFDVVMNPDGPANQVSAASEALDEVHRLEQLLTVYRDDSALMAVNRLAYEAPVTPEPELFALLRRGKTISEQAGGAFDSACGALIRLWQSCKRAGRLPTEAELADVRCHTGLSHVAFDDDRDTIRFDAPGVAFDLGAIGKGYAVDRAAERLLERGVADWLVHGGKSSVRVHGSHAGHDGWPIGLNNPLLPDRPYLTLLLKDAALCTSGTAVQWFRVGSKRYGHILDPRTGLPVDTMLSVSVIAPDAALADALSTAFFVLGVEKALEACDTWPSVGAIFFPYPADGRTLSPVVHGIPEERVFAEAGRRC